MDIKINDYDVVREGSLVVNPEYTISFRVEDLSFKFDFKKDDSNEKKLQDEKIGNKTLVVHILNFDNVVGTGYSTPIELATLSTGEKLYISFAVYSIAENLKIFHYTWLKRPVAQEGVNK